MLHLLFACGNVSNQVFEDDVLFTDALPSEDRTTLDLDDEADGLARADTGPVLRSYSVVYGAGVNQYLLSILDAVDVVRSLPPSTRDSDSRGWGPYTGDGGVAFSAEVNRNGEGRFDWLFDGDGSVFLAGTHYAGETVRSGDGQFVWDLTQVAAWEGSAYRGTLTVDYDNRSGVDLLVQVDDFSDGVVEPYGWVSAYRRVNDEGDFEFVYQADLDEDGLYEDVAIRTRWWVGGDGRADAVVGGGSLGAVEVRWSQCWDEDHALSYQSDDADYFEAYGAESACPYDDFAEVERL